MSIVEFKQPDFLDGVTAKTIEQNMMNNLPLDIDKTEGGFAWDLTYPTALEKAEILQSHLVRTLQIMFPMWATGRWLDKHAYDNGLERKAANKAYGSVTVTGSPGRTIPAGFVFAVPSDGAMPAIEFETLTEAVIPYSGTINVNVQAVVAGTGSNVANDTVTIMSCPVTGITKITNAAPITGGAAEESDDSLRQRIDDLLAGRGGSYVGNNSDYVRWAKEVPGVGFAHTIPEYHGPNSVKVVVVDESGVPANAQILSNVYTHIFGTNRNDMARLAPIGLTDFAVVAPAPVNINYAFRLKLTSGASADTVKSLYKAAMAKYYTTVASGNDVVKPVKWIQAAATLAGIAGVDDFKDLTINGAEESNVTFKEDEYPVTGTIEVTTYE